MANFITRFIPTALAVSLLLPVRLVAAPPLPIGSSFKENDLTPYMEVLADPGGNLSVTELSSSPYSSRFYRATGNNTNFSYTDAAVWVRFSLRNDSRVERSLYVKLSQPWVDRAELYTPTPVGYRVDVSGDTVPFSRRQVRDRNIVFSLSAPPGTTTCYMRLKTTSTLSLPVVVMSPEAYESDMRDELPLLWILYGVLAGMIVYNLFLYLLIRDRNYLYYILFIASILMYIMTRHGISFMYLWPENVWWANTSLSFFLLLCCVWFAQFARSFLNTSGTVRKLDYVLRGVVLASVIELVVVLTASGEYIDKMAVYSSMAAMIIVTLTAAVVLRRGERSARVYFIAWFIFLIAAVIDYSRGMGFLPDVSFTRYSMNIGTSLQVIIFSFGIAERITGLQRSRIRALEALTASEEKFRNLVENLNDVVFSLDVNGVFTYVSPSIVNLSRFYRPEDIIGMPFEKFIHPGDLPALVESREKTLSGTLEPFEYRLVDKDGKTLHVRSFSSPNYLNGELTGITGILSNITPYMEVLERLNSSEEKYRTLVENATEVIFVTQDLMVKFENTNAMRASGFSPEEVHSRPFVEFIHPEDRAIMLDRHMKRLRGEAVPDNFHFRMLSKSGDIRWMEISAVPISWEGRPAVLNFMNDITERKSVEEQIRASLREKEVLLKEIHHRVKNNMQIVSSLLNLQMDSIQSDVDRAIFTESQNRIHTMALIHEKMYQSQDLVNIDFSEYLKNLLKSLLQTYNVSPGSINIVFRVEDIFISIDTAIPCALIVNEIISNSLKYAFPGGAGGQLSISMDRVREESGETYVLSVGDNGVGMDPSVERNNPRTLGMQLVTTLARQLKGKLDISSKGGTVYTISFPVLR